MDSSKPPFLVYRSKESCKLLEGEPPCRDFSNIDDGISVESVCFSEDGKLIAWCDSNNIKVMRLFDKEVIFNKQNTFRTNCVYISPRSTKLVCYSPTTSGDNLHFFNITTQELLAAMPYKRASSWKPAFSMSESLCVQHINTDLVLYSSCNFEKAKRISHIKITDFSLSSASSYDSRYQHLYEKRVKNKNNHVAIYTASSSKGEPSIVKIFRYPNMNDCVTNKSFFNADRVKFYWSPSGNSLLLLCQSEFDKSGKSYYGKQTLQFMSIKSDSCYVKLPKEGTISHVEWLPSCDKDVFVCAYGFMPSKVSLFDHNCNMIHDFEPGSFNTASFSPFADLIAIYGFGNLTGQLAVIDLEKKKQLFTVKIPETSGLEWSADGKHFLTYTTTPRLRVNNGFRVWDYAGNLLHETVSDDSNSLVLYEVGWQPKPGGYGKPKYTAKPSKENNLLSQSNLQKFQKPSVKYVPPSMRKSTVATSNATFNSEIGFSSTNKPIVGLGSLKPSKPSKKKQTANKN